MKQGIDLEDADIDVTTHGRLPGAADYARRKIGALGNYTNRRILRAHVRLTVHEDPAVQRPVVAQANLDLEGRLVRAQAHGSTANEAIDRLDARLRRRLQRVSDNRNAQRGVESGQWRHDSEPTHRSDYFPRPVEERRIVRRKSYTLTPCSVDEAALEMELLDYGFHMFTEKGTGVIGVLYRSGPTGYRLALVMPAAAEQLAPFELPLTISSQPAPCITTEEARERLAILGLPFLFFIDAAEGRAGILYHRYDGHYGLITPAG